MMDLSKVFQFCRPDGSREFVCTECGDHVLVVIDFDSAVNVCRICQYIGEHPQLSDEVKALLRGEC